MHGGVKFYRGSASAARNYVEADRSRADDYYLAEGTGLADRFVAPPAGGSAAPGRSPVRRYERWVAGYDPDTGAAKGRLRTDATGLRFVEVVVNGPKTWSLAAALHPDIAAAYDAAQDRAAEQIIGWLAEHATTRVGPRAGRSRSRSSGIEAAVVRHYTSRAGDPHRHLHLQVNARVFAPGEWRGLHSVGVADSIEAINGIGHAAVITDPEFRAALAAHGYTLDPGPASWPSSRRTSGRSVPGRTDRPQPRPLRGRLARGEPGEEPGPRLRQAWDRRAWAQARPDKVVPTDGAAAGGRWGEELHALGFTRPTPGRTPASWPAPPGSGGSTATQVVEVVLTRLGARRSAWNAADIRGEVEQWIAGTGLVATPRCASSWPRTSPPGTVAACVPLLARADVPEHIRALTSPHVLDVEADLVDPADRPRRSPPTCRVRRPSTLRRADAVRGLDVAQQAAAAALAGERALLVVEGAAGAGKTTTLAAARDADRRLGHRLVVVTPTLKAARSPAARSAPTRSRRPGWPTSTATAGTTTATGPANASTRRSNGRRGCDQVTCCWSTRPGCSTRTPPAPCSPSPTRPAPGSRWWVTGTSSPPSAAAASWTSPPAGPDPRAGVPSTCAPVHRPAVRRPHPGDAHAEYAPARSSTPW